MHPTEKRNFSGRFSATLAAVIGAIAFGSSQPAEAEDFDYDANRPAELRACDDHRDHGRAEPARECYQKLLNSSRNTAVQAEAAWGLGDVRRANELFRATIQADEKAVRPRVRWGRLYLQTHQYSDAADLFREALEIDEDDIQARLAMARLLSDQFNGDARTIVAAVIEKSSERDRVQAHSLIEALLLASRMDLDEGKHGTAERSLNRAVSLAEEQKQPPLEAYELLAALDLLRNDEKLQRGEEKGNRWLERTVAYNPRYGGAYETLAHYEVMRRKYREASGWLQKAVQAEPTRWSAQAEYGVNLLRLGEVDGARSALEKAYAGDPFSATTVNTLRVLDKLKNFSVTPARLSTLGGSAIPGASSSSNTSGMTPGTGATAGTNATRGTSATPGASPPADLVTWLDPKEADAIRPYVEQVAGDSITTFAKRYGFQPKQPVTIELYPNHDDFAVRTAGLPGIGLLGVTFGYLVAMDSPSGRAAGDFHWASTLWHEMAHVFTLSVTDHRVPRWLSEGISVFEEWRTGPTPGIAVSPRALDVFREGKFLPVATLDEGFIRPDYEDQVQVSYMQSGLICYFIEQKWGFDKLVALLRQFTKDTTTAAAVEATFKISPKDFDKELATFLNQRFKGILENSEEWQKTMAATHVAADQKDWPNTIRNARRAIELFPDFTLDGSAYLPLARALNETGKRAEAVKALEDYRRLGGWNPTAFRELATWLEEAGNVQAAADIHHALVLIEPLDGTLHAKLGERYAATGKATDSLREYKVLLALNPHDTASANFGIARALNSLGDRAQSRRHLLEALETAPHFRPAQDLLLDLSGKPTP